MVFFSDAAGCCTGNRCLQSASRCRAARDARRATGHSGWLSTDSSWRSSAAGQAGRGWRGGASRGGVVVAVGTTVVANNTPCETSVSASVARQSAENSSVCMLEELDAGCP
eukprot:16447763-Heterocapsa_arctica.AAC.1